MALVTNELNATTIVLQSNVETLEVEINGKQSMVGYHLPGLPRSETPEVDNLCWALRGGLPGSHVWGEGVPYLTSPGGGEVPYHVTYPIMHFVLPRVRIGLEMNLPPPTCGQTDACEIIAFPQLRLRGCDDNDNGAC